MIKKIVIKNEKDYKKFLRKIKYYRSLLFNNTKFILENKYNNTYID